MATPSAENRSPAGRILNNSFWFGLETVVEAALFLATSVAVARYLGPTKLGYFSYINFFVMVVNRTGGSGLASATRKYMAEFIGRDQVGVARAVYNFTWRYQLIGSVFFTCVGLLVIFLTGDPHYRLMSTLLMLSIIPGSMSWIPAMANVAFEDLSHNTISAFGYLFSYTAIIVATIYFHWDLAGVAAAALIGRTAEMLLRTFPLNARLRRLPLDPMPEGLMDRIRRFCLQALGVQVLMSVVWDRSEMVFLRHFATLEQIAFYSVSYGLANNLLMVPRIFGGATATTLMVEAGRDPRRVGSIVNNATRYLLLVVLPVHLGAAAITSQAIQITYGAKYIGAIPVLIVAAILAIPRAFQELPEILMRTADRQNDLLWCLAATGVLNIALDAALIPHHAAVGAAWANGLAQAFGVMLTWVWARRLYRFSFPAPTTVRLLVASSVMAGVAFFLGRAVLLTPASHALRGIPAVALPILVAIPLYVVLVKFLHGLEPSDRLRLAPVGNRLPGPMRRAFDATITFVTPA